MTEAEKANIMNITEAVIACGGGTMTPDSKRRVMDVLDGKMSEEEAIAQLKAEYGVPS